MKEWRKAVVLYNDSIIKTIELIDRAALQIALVVDENNILKGTVTDGDVRRAILKGLSFDSPISSIMNTNFSFSYIEDGREKALATMASTGLHQLPILDKDGYLEGLLTIDSLLISEQRDNTVVLMAGGLGSRLRPLTTDCPKPLLKIGEKPLLETILESFIEQGFVNVYISINYKGDMIENYFEDGSRWGLNIKYIREKEYLGTAGALGLLPKSIDKPAIVMNGDILTKVDFRNLLTFHDDQKADATICVREYLMEIPFGVVSIDKNKLQAIEEKPQERFLVNAGLYVLNPDIIEQIPKNIYLDMPELFKRLIRDNRETAVFPIREYWLDIGRIGDYERANGEYREVLGGRR